LLFHLVQTPAPVYDIQITPYQDAACVTWKIRTAPEYSSYITNIIVCLNGTKCQNESRGTKAFIQNLSPRTFYTVEIETQDGSSQKSTRISKSFKTKKTGTHSEFYCLNYSSNQ
jgi:hypothetical protein